MISRVVALIGTASPTPMPATAVFTPTIRPALSASTPPLLPGLSAASVWTTSSITRPDAVGSERPERGDDARGDAARPGPSGLPSAMTSWPTRSARGVAERDRWRDVAARVQDGEVGQRVAADDVRAHGRPVGERRVGHVRADHHVRAGQQVAVGR